VLPVRERVLPLVMRVEAVMRKPTFWWWPLMMSLKRKGCQRKGSDGSPKAPQDSPGRELPGLVILEYEGEEDAEGAVPGILKKMAALQK
jgi:hypothetical protein